MVSEVAATERILGTTAKGDFVIRLWRSRASAARDPFIRRFRAATRPGELELQHGFPNGGGERRPRVAEEETGYTSLRDLMDSPMSLGGDRTPATTLAYGGGEIRIKNYLVKQAAYAYLQPTPSASEFDRRRRRSLRRIIAILTCGLAVEPIYSCVEFLRSLFRRSRPRR